MTIGFATATAAWTITVAAAFSAPATGSQAISEVNIEDRTAATCTIQTAAHTSHIRPMHATLETSLEHGLARSPSLRRLVERIELLKGIVYIESAAWIHAGADLSRLSGATSLNVVPAGDHRILRVKVEPRSDNRTIATIGHELQHVIEILESPEARDPISVEHLFARIGYVVRPGVYETAAALSAGDRVFRELSTCPRLEASSNSEPIRPNVTR
jgi:hypothetical protein